MVTLSFSDILFITHLISVHGFIFNDALYGIQFIIKILPIIIHNDCAKIINHIANPLGWVNVHDENPHGYVILSLKSDKVYVYNL